MFDLPSDFKTTLKDKYHKAAANEDILKKSDGATHEIVHFPTMDIRFTLLKSLEHRPEKDDKKDQKDEDPLAKVEPEMTIVEDFGKDNSLRLVYNKFPVTPYHFMMVTKEFVEQETPLSPDELEAIYTVCHELGDDWFAFFNCGPESGASQPHKHVQFLTKPLPEDDKFTCFAEKLAMRSEPFLPNSRTEPLQAEGMKFAHFIARLPDEDLSGEDLLLFYALLLQRAFTVARDNDVKDMSYNFIMTTKWMMIVPRKTAKFKGPSSELSLGINSCGFYGLILCKNDDLFDLVKEVGPEEILGQVGFPSTAGQKSDEYHY